MHIPDASLYRADVRATPAVERHGVEHPDACAGSAHRLDGVTPGATPRHTRRHKRYCRDRSGRRCSPTRCSPGSYTAGSSPPALAPHAPTALDSAGLRGAKYLCGRSPPQASHRWRPGGFDRFPGLLCFGVGLKLRAESRSALRTRQSRARFDTGASAADRGRLRFDYVRNDVRKPKRESKFGYRAPVVKPRLSPESRGFESPSTQLTTDGHKPYLQAVETSFGGDIDYALLVKLYGEPKGAAQERRYSSGECCGTIKGTVCGTPDDTNTSPRVLWSAKTSRCG